MTDIIEMTDDKFLNNQLPFMIPLINVFFFTELVFKFRWSILSVLWKIVVVNIGYLYNIIRLKLNI
jgi:hypothetical protein